jgi:hypothetical protein
MNPIQHMNDVMETMITEFLEQIADALELDIDELKEEYIDKPKTTPTECFLTRVEKIKIKNEKKEDNAADLRCIARIYNDSRNHTQCPCEQTDGCFCKRHSKKHVHGTIINPVFLMKQHDFRKHEQYYPICVENISYMYEPFSQKAVRLKDMEVYYIHSTNGENVTITKRRKENCVYKIRWRGKLSFLWNITTKEVMDTDTGEVIGSLDKCNKKWSLSINN